MHAKVFSATTIGVNSHLVDVEVDLSLGMLQFFIVGLPDRAINESKQRISTALKNSGIRLPERKITVNLAPADLKKEGTLFDLPIAVALLQASRLIQLSSEFIEETLFLGELSLDGSIRFVKGMLPVSYDAAKFNKKRIILPAANAPEAALIEHNEVIGVHNMQELVAYLRGEVSIAPTRGVLQQYKSEKAYTIDFDQVKGQFAAKRTLQIAAAGRHNLLFMGPPGSGKTMLAQRLPTIMPSMSFDEIIQTSKIYSVCGKLEQQPLVVNRPFRNPHHTISQAGLVGGGSNPQPGEISLAHNGILFLDELTEFKRTTLEVLRQPLENKEVCIARAQQTITFPASLLLVAALNPCPCGFLGDKKRECTCSAGNIEKYLGKLSGPLLDRIDLQVFVQSVEYDTVKDNAMVHQSSAMLYEAVERAVAMQHKRFGNSLATNGSMTSDQIEKYCRLTDQAEELIKKAFAKLHLSMRGYHKILKVARTIADLEGYELIDKQHMQEALSYKTFDQTLLQAKS